MHAEAYRELCEPIQTYLDRDDAQDICINRPGDVWMSTSTGWEHDVNDRITTEWINRFVFAVSQEKGQATNDIKPTLSTTLQSSQRLQAVLMPAAVHDSVTIRRPSDKLFSLDDFQDQGALELPVKRSVEDIVKQAKSLYDSNRVKEFMRFAVKNRLNIIVSGATASGKTTLTNALVNEIDHSERLIAIEDSEELQIQQPNVVRLIYSRDNSGKANTTAEELLTCCLRMAPNRILLSEVRGPETFFYLKNVNSGHPGSITSIHAESAPAAVNQMVNLIKESNASGGMSPTDIRESVCSLVHVILHWENKRLAGSYFPGLKEEGRWAA